MVRGGDWSKGGEPPTLQAAYDHLLKTGDGFPLADAIWAQYGGTDPAEFDSALWGRAVRYCDGDLSRARDLFDDALMKVYFEVREDKWNGRLINDIRQYVPDAIRKQMGKIAGALWEAKDDPSMDDPSLDSESLGVSDAQDPAMTLVGRRDLLAAYVSCRDKLATVDRVVADMMFWGASNPVALPFALDALDKYLRTPDGRSNAADASLTKDAARFAPILTLGHLSASALGAQVSKAKERIKVRLIRCMTGDLQTRGLEANDFFDGDWVGFLTGGAT